ncbi:MAG: Zn-dependent hydrolase [Ruminococcaceae bacterium]|nr:Zn-dependent hydrolase [Oscillospiraceae bacterium]
MKKTYVTNMPDDIGAFLQASRRFAALGINISRVSYNKAIDAHTLFIDAEGTPEQLAEADKQLAEIGYLGSSKSNSNVILMEFQLIDAPGGVTEILELIEKFSFNISYISSQGDNSEYQFFKIGLFVEDPGKINDFISEAEKLCNVRVIDYNRSEKNFDNSIFYNSFVSSLINASKISAEKKNELLVNTNLAMQQLDELGLSPYKTFDSISKFADMLASCKGEAFSPRITTHKITDNTEITTIEPPCGSNTTIIKSCGQYLFVDSGYSYYRDEMLELFRTLIPDFDNIKKSIFVTHADVDHCGLLNMFDEIYASRKTRDCLALAFEGVDDFREQNYLHKPYLRICKTLTEYEPADPGKIVITWDAPIPEFGDIWQIGFFTFGELKFEVYEGRGGHIVGETILIDYENRVAFTGDVYVNLKAMTSEQKKYNQYAPILMTSVDTDPAVSKRERESFMQRLGAGKWKIFCGHGAMKDYELKIEE